MRKWIRWAVCLLPLFLAGCFESNQHFTLNPDGSGKVVLETRFQPILLGTEKLDQRQLNHEVLGTMEKSEGVEAWNDVTYRAEPDGRIYFKGTGYFKDINKVNLDKGSTVRWIKQGADSVLQIVDRNPENEDHAPQTRTTPLTEAEISQRILAERKEWQRSKPEMESMLNTLIMDAVIDLPGKVSSATNLKRAGDSSVSFHFEGAKMVAGLDKLISSDEWMKKMAREGKLEDPDNGPPMGADLNEIMFGQKGGVEARVSGTMKPLFDYAVESQAAKAAYAKIRESLEEKKQ